MRENAQGYMTADKIMISQRSPSHIRMFRDLIGEVVARHCASSHYEMGARIYELWLPRVELPNVATRLQYVADGSMLECREASDLDRGAL